MHRGQKQSWLAGIAVFAAAGVMWGAMPGGGPANRPINGPATSPATALPPATRTAEQRKRDDIARVMEFFRLTQPDVYEQATALRVSDPAKFDRLILGALPTVNRLEGLKRKSQKLFELSMLDMQLGYQSLRISQKLKSTGMPAAERVKLTDQMREIVTADFAIQQQIRQLEIEDLQQKVKDLDNRVKDREKDQSNIIQKRMNDLVDGNPKLEW
jgi:hypothetical protein